MLNGGIQVCVSRLNLQPKCGRSRHVAQYSVQYRHHPAQRPNYFEVIHTKQLSAPAGQSGIRCHRNLYTSIIVTVPGERIYSVVRTLPGRSYLCVQSRLSQWPVQQSVVYQLSCISNKGKQNTLCRINTCRWNLKLLVCKFHTSELNIPVCTPVGFASEIIVRDNNMENNY